MIKIDNNRVYSTEAGAKVRRLRDGLVAGMMSAAAGDSVADYQEVSPLEVARLAAEAAEAERGRAARSFMPPRCRAWCMSAIRSTTRWRCWPTRSVRHCWPTTAGRPNWPVSWSSTRLTGPNARRAPPPWSRRSSQRRKNPRLSLDKIPD